MTPGRLAGHDYDPISDAVVSWTIEPGASATQAIHLDHGRHIGAVRVKLRRSGHPGGLGLRLGSRLGEADLAEATIAPEDVNPWFEQWCAVAFEVPLAAPSGTIHLQLRLPAESTGAYEWFGTATVAVPRQEFHPQFRYTPTFYPTGEDEERFENPANLDYGVETELYRDGASFDSHGNAIAGLSFAFAVDPSGASPQNDDERFSFIRSITGPVYERSLRDPSHQAGPDEVFVDDSWALVRTAAGPVTELAAREFRDFMRIAMNVDLIESAPKVISVAVDEDAATQAEGFRLTVREESIAIVGRDDRGAMRGLHHVETLMRTRRGPVLPKGVRERAPRFSPRITCAPFYSKLELTAPIDPYTDGLLGRISRAGFNAIWVWGDLDQVAHSEVFPELDDGVRARQSRLNDLVARAARYGVDVYLYLANRPLPETFFARHPGVRGSAFPAYGGVNVVCTSVSLVQNHLRSAAADLARSVPGLRGVVCLVGGEGLMHCHTRDVSCARCLERPAHETVAQLCDLVLKGIRSANPTSVVAVWPYSATNTWSSDDSNQARLMKSLSPGVTWLTEFEKEGAVTFGGRTIPAYDYSIAISGPSERFVQQASLTADLGMDLWVKTEHAISLEFIQTPYIPAFYQWADRFARLMGQAHASGAFCNWMHYGFMPTPAADLLSWTMFADPSEAPETAVERVARSAFGDAAAPLVLSAWRLFSKAIREYPFSGGVAAGVIQKGPAHPLFLDPDYRPAHGALRQFANDLTWTQPWGPDIVIHQLGRMERTWAAGVRLLENTAADGPAYDDALRREFGVASALLACIRSAINIASFYRLRAGLPRDGEPGKARRIVDGLARIAENELRNATAALAHVRADSRLGYANSGANDQVGVPRAGIYSPGSIEKKIAQVTRLLDDELPAYLRAKEPD